MARNVCNVGQRTAAPTAAPEIEALVKAGAVFLTNHSGGKDSSAMLAHLCQKFPQVKKYVVFADTGFEHIKPVSAENWARQIANQFGLDLNVARNPNKNLLTMVKARGMFPSPSCRQCTSDLKRDPIRTWMRRNIPEKLIINCMGLRAEESPSRAKAVPLRRLNISNSNRTVWEWLPIHAWTLQQVLDFHFDYQIPLHPVYVWAGGYLKRFSCRICIMMRDEEIKAVYHNDREAFDAIASLEQEIGFTMKQGKTLYQIAGVNA